MSKTSGRSTVVDDYVDGRPFSKAHILEITQEWVDLRMNEQVNEFTTGERVTIFTGTWNVNAKKQEGALDEWLLHANTTAADIYAIGFQEIVDLNAMNVALDSSKTLSRSQFWHEKIMESLSTLTDNMYYLVGTKSLVGLLLCVYAKDRLSPHISDLRVNTIGVGVMGMLGNKGAVSVRLSVFDSSIAFVCAHLAAHRENVVGRNKDFKNIVDKLSFPVEEKPRNSIDDEEIRRPKFGAERNRCKDLKILDHEIVFWIGDLNYRLDEVLDVDDIFKKCKNEEWSILREMDQLNIERRNGHVFNGFHEGILNFAPTYKYQPGTDEYDRRPEKKIRAPAWCDRILWRTTNITDPITQLIYDRANLLPSDHKPVYASFQCGVRKVDPVLEEAKYRYYSNELEFWKPRTDYPYPMVDVEGLDMDFGKVKFGTRETRVIKISNAGAIYAHWRLIPRIEMDKRLSKRFLSFSQTRGMLMPRDGELGAFSSVEIIVTFEVDAYCAHGFNAGKESFEDMVILRIENLEDKYITVKADYQRSSFGMSLEELLLATGPVRTLPRRAAPDPDSVGTSVIPKQGVPKELWLLVDALWRRGVVSEKDVFFTAVSPVEVGVVRDAIDEGADIPASCSIHAIAEALSIFLSSLMQPIIPADAFPVSEVDEKDMKAWSRSFLERGLTTLNYNVFIYIISFLREILALSESNGSSAECFTSTCMTFFTGPRNEEVITKEDLQKREIRQEYMSNIIQFFLTSDDF
jgi:phosphatidylinositol-bisphosphatase